MVSRILCFSILILTSIFSSGYAQNQIQQDPEQKLIALLSKVEEQLNRNSQNILTDKVSVQVSELSEIKDNLDILLDVFMPLTERLKKLQLQEKMILNKTQNLVDQFVPISEQDHKKQNQSIIQDQLLTRNETKKTRDIVQQQKDHIAANSKGQSKPDVNQKKMFNQLSEYINLALKSENLALNQLNDNQQTLAIPEQKKALTQIENALKLLSPPQDDKDKNKKQSQNNQQDKKQKKDQQSKNNQGKDDQGKDDQGKDDQGKDDQGKQKQNSQKKKKLSAEEALKLLAQLQKKAEKERKEREKEYGVTISPQQLPVERDW